MRQLWLNEMRPRYKPRLIRNFRQLLKSARDLAKVPNVACGLERGRIQPTLLVTTIVLAAVMFLNAGCRVESPEPLAGASHSVTIPPPGEKVVVFVIDGPRMSEMFDDPSHQHVPNLWDSLRPLGTVVENFRNNGTTLTVSGHASLLSGTLQSLNNQGLENPTSPTFFEYYRQATGAPQNDAVIVGGKQKLGACAYSTDPSYGAAYGAKIDLGFNTDIDTYNHFITSLQNDQPHFIMVSFSRVDTRAHSGDWPSYLNQIEVVDSLAMLTWNYLQSDPFYQNQTTMFITADHGRHDDANGGFQAHGDLCQGCQRLPFLALGPNIRQNHTVLVQSLYTQRDLCRTIGTILDIPTPSAGGFVMYELFVPTATGIAR
jgi:hypothetical protein